MKDWYNMCMEGLPQAKHSTECILGIVQNVCGILYISIGMIILMA